MNRVWLYRDWDGRRLLLSSDERGYRTLLIRLWGELALVIALFRCRCPECHPLAEEASA